jgi:hypothetical protein
MMTPMRTALLIGCLAVAIGCSKKKDAVPAPAPTPPAAAPEEPAAAPEPTRLPAVADIEHGKVYWAVYFSNAPLDAPAFRDAQKRAKQLGFEIFHKDPNCDVAAGEPPAAPADPSAENYLISVYFEAEADARAVATAWGDPTPWVGQVMTMCLD